MAGFDNHFTIFIRLPFNRGDFVDPPPVAWSATKERALWDILSRQSKGNEVDWGVLAGKFEVTQTFLLQQAAWLYERQLSQVRAQMRRVGNRQSATPSPIPNSVTASMIGGQAMKRGGSGGSRVPSRLSTQALGSPIIGADASIPGTPAKSRTSLPLRTASGTTGPRDRNPSTTSRPLSRQSSKDADIPPYQLRRGSTQQVPNTRSPGQTRAVPVHNSDSEDDMSQSRMTTRRPNPATLHRRTVSRKEAQPQRPPHNDAADDSEDDDDDTPSFLPFATPKESNLPPTSPQDPSATLRGTTAPRRPSTNRRSTSERIINITTSPHSPNQSTPTTAINKSNPKANSNPNPDSNPHPSSRTSSPSSSSTTFPNPPASQPQSNAHRNTRLANRKGSNPLSPRQQAALASAAGLSPRPSRHAAGSDTSPSMGSSFSDLDDASVTQSALEEALLSGMGNTAITTAGGTGGGQAGSVASRVSGISQALRSRYFDQR